MKRFKISLCGTNDLTLKVVKEVIVEGANSNFGHDGACEIIRDWNLPYRVVGIVEIKGHK